MTNEKGIRLKMENTQTNKLINVYSDKKTNVNNNKNDITDKDFKTEVLKKSIDDLNILYTNIDSLTNKFDELQAYVNLYKSDIVMISETQPKKFSK